LKNTPFGVGGVTQVIEHLPSKCEALSSNPSTAKKEKKKNPFQFMAVELAESVFLTSYY
jgi:hypothetical protein